MFNARSRRILALALAALAMVLIAACGSSKKSSSSGDASDPAAIIPAATTVYVEANINPSATQKSAFNSLSQNVLDIPDPGDRIVAAVDKAAAKDGVTYEKDIKPWLGDKLAIAVTQIGKGNSSIYAVVIDTTDPDKAMAAITKNEGDLQKGKINDVSYVVTKDGTYAGTIGNYLVLGPRAGFAVIASGKGDKLADNATFKEARAKAPADRLAYLYVDFDSFLSYAASTQASLSSQVGTFKGLFGNIKALSASLVAAPTSVEIDATVVGLKSSGSPSGVSALPLGKAPANAWAAIALRNVGPALTKELNALGKIGAGSSGQDFGAILAQLKAATGVDVENDLLSWMGDAGGFVEGTSLADIGAAVVIKSTDPAKSQAAIGKVAELLTRLGRSSDKLDVPGGTGIEFATTATGPKVQIAAVGSLFYIAFGKTALHDAMNPATTLDSTDTYNDAVASLKGTDPALYVDLHTVFGFVDQFAGTNAQYQKVKPYLDRFTSLIAGYGNGTAKIVLNVKATGSSGGASTTTSTAPSTAPPTATASAAPAN